MDIEHATRFLNLFGKLIISHTRGYISTWVVMRNNDARRKAVERGGKYDARIHYGTSDAAHTHHANGNHLTGIIEIQHVSPLDHVEVIGPNAAQNLCRFTTRPNLGLIYLI